MAKSIDFVLERFLAKEFGFAGKNNAEQAQADEIVDVIVDLIDEQVLLSFVVSCSALFYQSSAIVVRLEVKNQISDAFRSDSILEKTRQSLRNTRRNVFQPS